MAKFEYPCLSLARRIEALQRTLADPKAAILRTARFLASFTAEAISAFDFGLIEPRWLHGSRENFQARSHAIRAIMILSRALQPRPG